MNKKKWFLNGGRGSGRSIRLLCETYENKIADLEKENAELKKVKQVKIEVTRDYKKLAKDLQEQGEQLAKAMKHLKDLVYVVELGKNELATARILAEAKEFLKEE